MNTQDSKIGRNEYKDHNFMKMLRDFFGFGERADEEAKEKPLIATVLPEQQREKLERDMLILEEEYGIKERQLQKEAEKQVQVAAEDSLKQLHVMQMGVCPRCGEHLNTHLFATICEACGWNAYEVPKKGPVRVHLRRSDAVIEGEVCYVIATGDVFILKEDVVVAKVSKDAISWIEYVWKKEEVNQRYKQIMSRLKIVCGWCEKEVSPADEGIILTHVAFGSTQERYIFCSTACYDAFRKMYPARVHRNCYERKCADCNLCIKRFDDETESMHNLLKDFMKSKYFAGKEK